MEVNPASEQAPDSGSSGSRRSPLPPIPGTEWLNLSTADAATGFPAPAGIDAPEGEKMVVDPEEDERLSQISSISLVPRTDDELSDGELESPRDLPNDPQVKQSLVPEIDLPRDQGANLTLANGFKWADDPLTDEEEPERAVEGEAAVGGSASSSPGSQVAAFREETNELRPHRSMHRETATGRTYELELHQIPLPVAPSSNEPLRRPHRAEPDVSRGAIPKATKRGRPRSPAGTMATGHRRSATPGRKRERSLSRRSSPPPPGSPQPSTPAGREPSPLPTFQRRLRFTSPSGRLLTCQEVYREELRTRWPIVILPHIGEPTERDGTRRPRKLRGCRFGNLESIPSHHTLDPRPHTCFNCREDCKDGRGHEAMDCPEAYVLHCENCGRRGVNVLDCPRCGVAYIRDRYYIENEWAAADRPAVPEPGATRRSVSGHAWKKAKSTPPAPRPAPNRREVYLPEVNVDWEPARRSVGTSPQRDSPMSPEPSGSGLSGPSRANPSGNQGSFGSAPRPARPANHRGWAMWMDEPVHVPISQAQGAPGPVVANAPPPAPAPAVPAPVHAPPAPLPAPPAPAPPAGPAPAPEAAQIPQGRPRSMAEVLEMAMTLAPDLREQVLRRYMEELFQNEHQ